MLRNTKEVRMKRAENRTAEKVIPMLFLYNERKEVIGKIAGSELLGVIQIVMKEGETWEYTALECLAKKALTLLTDCKSYSIT